MTPAISSLEGRLSNPDDTNVLTPRLSAYPVANDYINARVCDMNANDNKDENSDSCSELDSHANIFVLGQYCCIISSSGRHAEVNDFDREVGRMKIVAIVDTGVVYNCPYSMKTYPLIVRNALYVQLMMHNLIPPFIMREAVLKVREIQNIYVKEPTVDDHLIYFLDKSLQIALSLNGIF